MFIHQDKVILVVLLLLMIIMQLKQFLQQRLKLKVLCNQDNKEDDPDLASTQQESIPLAQSSSTTGSVNIADADLQRKIQVALEASHLEFKAKMQYQEVEQIRHILEESTREQERREAAILECFQSKTTKASEM
ncbi:MAG: hypothetical protein EZS28_043509, partial [Streblomastix strix]